MNRRAFAAAFPATVPVLMGYLSIGMAFGFMLEAVGYGFLMENGSPELRSRVPYLALPNTEYGVARVLQQVLRQKGCVCPADFTKAH